MGADGAPILLTPHTTALGREGRAAWSFNVTTAPKVQKGNGNIYGLVGFVQYTVDFNNMTQTNNVIWDFGCNAGSHILSSGLWILNSDRMDIFFIT